MAMMSRSSRRFREMLESGKTYVQPGVFNAQSAIIAERAGFETVSVSGYSLSATLIGKPDVGLMTAFEVAQVTGYICDAVKIPVLADADTGYGNALNTIRTVQQFIKAGVAAMFIEDQVAPKRCGHVSGKEVISLEEAVGKYRAAVDTRDDIDRDVVLIARCDARGVAGGSIEETVRRGRAYLDAGMDVFFPEGVTSIEELAFVADQLRCPILYNRTGVSPNLSREDCQRYGVFIVASGGAAIRGSARGMWDDLHALYKEDAVFEQRIAAELEGHPVGDMHSFVGFPEIWRLEAKYLPDTSNKKYEGSLGFRPQAAGDAA